MIHISTSNSKLSGEIPSISLPPQASCRADAPCKKGCYACKGTFLYKNVQDSLKANLKEFISDSDNYFNSIIKYLNGGLVIYKFFRWHTAGDIVNEKYLLGMIEVARKSKQTKFLCFTKKFELINDYIKNGGKFPSNLKVVFSAWDNTFEVINPYKFPVAYVLFKDSSKNPDIPPLSIRCVGDCANCLSCWQLVKGQTVCFHQH